jgi:hypothetical protein
VSEKKLKTMNNVENNNHVYYNISSPELFHSDTGNKVNSAFKYYSSILETNLWAVVMCIGLGYSAFCLPLSVELSQWSEQPSPWHIQLNEKRDRHRTTLAMHYR